MDLFSALSASLVWPSPWGGVGVEYWFKQSRKIFPYELGYQWVNPSLLRIGGIEKGDLKVHLQELESTGKQGTSIHVLSRSVWFVLSVVLEEIPSEFWHLQMKSRRPHLPQCHDFSHIWHLWNLQDFIWGSPHWWVVPSSMDLWVPQLGDLTDTLQLRLCSFKFGICEDSLGPGDWQPSAVWCFKSHVCVFLHFI